MRKRSALALLLMLGVAATPAAALDLFTSHEVTARFATHDGKPMANAEVRVFSPGNPQKPALTGHADKDGKFVFPADRDGFWTAEATTPGEVARVMIKVGDQPRRQLVSPVVVFGVLGVLLLVAVWYRFLRRRGRARP